jgi:hypothetical protein
MRTEEQIGFVACGPGVVIADRRRQNGPVCRADVAEFADRVTAVGAHKGIMSTIVSSVPGSAGIGSSSSSGRGASSGGIIGSSSPGS